MDGNAIKISVQNLPVALRGKTLDLFPETPEVIETAAQWTQAWNGAVWTASVPLSPQRSNSPSPDASGAGRADGVGVPCRAEGAGHLAARWPPWRCRPRWRPRSRPTRRRRPAGPAVSAVAGHAAAALLGALLGGLILNLMPCVFPVLAIKVVGFTQHADNRRATAGRHGLHRRRGAVVHGAGRADAGPARGG
jgi:hypothetical protein